MKESAKRKHEQELVSVAFTRDEFLAIVNAASLGCAVSIAKPELRVLFHLVECAHHTLDQLGPTRWMQLCDRLSRVGNAAWPGALTSVGGPPAVNELEA